MATALRLDHLAGRFDREPITLDAQVSQSTKHVDLIALTEVSGHQRAKVLDRPGWTVLRGPDGDLGEVAILARDAEWRVLAWKVVVLGPDLGPGGQVVGIIAVFENVHTGDTELVGEAHLPATVEGGFLARTRRAAAHQAAVQKWRREVRRWRRRYKPDGEVITADWNLNLHRAFVRAWITVAWPAMHLPKRIPAAATHRGGRLIDWPIAHRIPDLAFRVLAQSPASDHRGIRVTGTIRPRKKRKKGHR